MTNVKKVVAVMLAFLMIFSSASVLASAWDATADDGSALNIETKFFKKVSGEWVETTKVKPNDVVKARVYLSTDYYSNDSSLLFFYDKDFFTHSYSTSATERADIVNTEADSFAAENNVTARVAADPIELRKLVAEGYIDNDFLNEYGAISAVVRVKSKNENNVMYDGSTWLLEFTLTVKETATGEGDFFVKDTTVQNSTTQTYAAVNVPKGPATGTDSDIWAMWLWDANVTLASNPVSTMSSITFNANSGEFADGTGEYVVNGMIDAAVDATAIPAVTRDGYAFMGWIDAADATPTYEEILAEIPATIPENELVLNAYWMETVDITFDTGDGSAIETITGAKPYDTFADIADPTLDGYTFKGWDVKGGELPETYPDKDTTYTAIWAKQVTVSFDTDGAAAIEAVKGDAGDAFEAVIANPSKDGYYFIGWQPALPTVFPEADTTYTALYDTHSYRVEYYVDGKRASVTQIEYGEPIPTLVPTVEIVAGETLSVWYTDADCTTAFVAGTKMPALAEGESFKLYAKTSLEAYDAIFMVDGEVYATVRTEYDADIIAPTDEPTKEGYTFAGWDPFVGTMEAHDMTFNAQWTVNEYKITYKFENETYEEFKVAYGDEFEVAAGPDKDGYAFIGWSQNPDATAAEVLPEFMPAENLTYYAIFEITERTATFYDYEALAASPYKSDVLVEYSSANVTVGATIEFPADPTTIDSAYWTFLGWATEEGGEVIADTSAVVMGEEDVAYYAVYEKVAVKLMPKAGTTTMIERNGAIESYNDGYTVSTDFVATTDSTKNLIYGLKVNLRNTVLGNWVEVQGDGYFVVTPVVSGRLGTGTLVEVYDNADTSAPVETFYVVIFGDVDGNARVTVDDQTVIDGEVASPSWSSNRTKVEYLFRAANLDGNRRLTIDDGVLVASAAAGAVIDQLTGKVS